jgi:hypothetical protein
MVLVHKRSPAREAPLAGAGSAAKGLGGIRFYLSDVLKALPAVLRYAGRWRMRSGGCSFGNVCHVRQVTKIMKAGSPDLVRHWDRRINLDYLKKGRDAVKLKYGTRARQICSALIFWRPSAFPYAMATGVHGAFTFGKTLFHGFGKRRKGAFQRGLLKWSDPA